MSTRAFLDSAENPVPMLPGESYATYADRLLACGRAREWGAARDRWTIERYRARVAAEFGERQADAHLRRVGIR